VKNQDFLPWVLAVPEPHERYNCDWNVPPVWSRASLKFA
jgi:hypothetical protein